MLNTIQILGFTPEYVDMDDLREIPNGDIIICTIYEDEGGKDPVIRSFIMADYLIFCLN